MNTLDAEIIRIVERSYANDEHTVTVETACWGRIEEYTFTFNSAAKANAVEVGDIIQI